MWLAVAKYFIDNGTYGKLLKIQLYFNATEPLYRKLSK